MKVGDKLKVIEQRSHKLKPRNIIGRITDIDSHKITIMKIKNGQDTYKISFNIADLKAKGKQYFKYVENEWKEIKFNIVNGG